MGLPCTSINGLGNVYPAMAKREPAPAIGINTFNFASRHGILTCNVLPRSSIADFIYSQVTSCVFSTASSFAPLSTAPCLPI